MAQMESHLGSSLPAARGFIGVERRQQIEYAGGRKESCAIITIGVGNVRSANLNIFRQPVKAPRAQVRKVPERCERVSALRIEQIATHSCSYKNQHAYNAEKC
jgi:hypothetical protein